MLHHVEILTLAGYLIGGEAFSEFNQKFFLDVDYITRGGRVPFICGLDGNKTPAEWSNVKWGSLNFLTCRGKAGTTGGSMIDYFLVSKVLLGLIDRVLADFSYRAKIARRPSWN